MWFGSAHVERLFVRGVEPEYIDVIPLFSVADGRFISPYDEEHSRSVVVHRRRHRGLLVPARRSGRQDRQAERPAIRRDRRVRTGCGTLSAASASINSRASRCRIFTRTSRIRETAIAVMGRDGSQLEPGAQRSDRGHAPAAPACRTMAKTISTSSPIRSS